MSFAELGKIISHGILFISWVYVGYGIYKRIFDDTEDKKRAQKLYEDALYAMKTYRRDESEE